MTTDVVPPPSPAGASGEAPSKAKGSARRAAEPLLTRLHFLSGFLVAPIVLSLAVTGILFAWNPQIETALHKQTLRSSAPEAQPRPLAEQVRAAQEARPGWAVTAVTPAAPGVFEGRETTAIAMKPAAAADASGHGPAADAISVYVDPASARVTGEIDEAERPAEWLRNLHSSWRLGDNVAPLTELAASWLLVSIFSGLYLRWPVLRRSLRKAVVPRLRQPGWRRAQALHTTLGLWLSVSLLALVGTGLTWTNFAGSRVDDLKATFSSPVPAVETTLPGAAAAPAVVPPAQEHAEHGGGPAPATPAGSPAGGGDGAAAPGSVPAPPPYVPDLGQVDAVAAGTAAAGVSGLVKFTPPTAEGKAWKVELRDTKWPVRPVNLSVDGSSGAVVDRVDWDERPLLQKATSIGIYFHQATLFGVWNQIYLTVLAIGVIVLIVAGYRMWWLRRPPGAFGAPQRAGPLWRSVPAPLMVAFALLAYAMPMLAVSFLLYLVAERIVRRLRREPADA